MLEDVSLYSDLKRLSKSDRSEEQLRSCINKCLYKHPELRVKIREDAERDPNYFKEIVSVQGLIQPLPLI